MSRPVGALIMAALQAACTLALSDPPRLAN